VKEASNDLLQQVDQHLSQANQAWLLGAGISKDAGLPLMKDLTAQVLKKTSGTNYAAILTGLKDELPDSAHIEHMLSQLGDYAAIAKRIVSSKRIAIGGVDYGLDELENAHAAITGYIAEVIRWGYIEAKDGVPEVIGDRDNLIVSVEHHSNFVHALFEKRQAGLREPRRPVHFFTTNYDTLLEDALALGRYPYWDGFSGGAVAFREHRFGRVVPSDGLRAKVVKLHGSIDWVLGEDGDVWRVRNTDRYPSRKGLVYIYPQSTKYVATQKDPFAAQFSILRELVGSNSELVLAVCGYSFGDEHINEELERALSAPTNKTTLIAFCWETNGLPPDLERWRQSSWGERVYVLTQKGLYWSNQEPLHQKTEGEHDWWNFQGVAKFLENGGLGAL
jgi:hypothetical protein